MSTERSLAPSHCDLHTDAEFDIGMGGGCFYHCGCVYDDTPGKVVQGQTGPWFRGMTRGSVEYAERKARA